MPAVFVYVTLGFNERGMTRVWLDINKAILFQEAFSMIDHKKKVKCILFNFSECDSPTYMASGEILSPKKQM